MSSDWDSDLDRRGGPELVLGTTFGVELDTQPDEGNIRGENVDEAQNWTGSGARAGNNT
jgi:hypothetical protein